MRPLIYPSLTAGLAFCGRDHKRDVPSVVGRKDQRRQLVDRGLKESTERDGLARAPKRLPSTQTANHYI
jgi:hypothetical protein